LSGNQGNDVCLAMLITYKEYLDIIIFEPDNIYIVSFPWEKLIENILYHTAVTCLSMQTANNSLLSLYVDRNLIDTWIVSSNILNQ